MGRALVILSAMCFDRYGPLSGGDGAYAIWPCHWGVASCATRIDYGMVVGIDLVAEVVLTQKLPDVVDRVQRGRIGWQVEQTDVGWPSPPV